MILKSVKLENIRSYINQEINFPDGSVLLSGDIGSGKSTILLAVEFALFGFRGKSLSGRTLLRHGKNQGSVELSFSLEGKEIIIKRNLKRGNKYIQQSSGYIVINGVKKDATAIELKASVLSLLGYPKELITKVSDLIYRYTVYTPQEEMRQILTEAEEIRLDTLRKVFGIDKYKKIKINTYIFVKNLKNKQEELSERISDFDIKKKEIDSKKEELNSLKEKLNLILPDYENIKKEIDNKKSLVDKYEQDVKQLNSYKNQLEINETKLNEKVRQNNQNNEENINLENEITLLRKKIIDIKEGREEELNKIIEEKTKLEQQVKILNESIVLLEKEVNSKKELIKDLDKKLLLFSSLRESLKQKDSVDKNIKDIELLIQEINKELNSFETKKKFSLNVKDQIQKLADCPTCLQKVPDFHKKVVYESEDKKILEFDGSITQLIKKRDLNIKELERIKKVFEEILGKERNLEAIKVEIENLKRISNEIVEKDEKLKDNLRNKEEIIAKLDIYDDIEDMKKELDKIREQKQLKDMLKDKEERKLKINSNLEEIKKQIGLINVEKIKLRENIDKLANVENEFSNLKKEFDSIKEKEKEILVKKTSFEKEIEGVEKIIIILDKDIKDKLEIKDKIKKINQYKDWLEKYFMSLMNNIEKHVMFNVQQEFNELFQQWFNMLMEDETINVRLDNNFTPVVEQNGYESFVENLSGGEKTAAALAYRLSLNRVINSMIGEIKTKDLIILDEPTDGFSSEQLDKVRDVLDEIDSNQVIIVSHESKIESFVDNVIRISKNEHVSSII